MATYTDIIHYRRPISRRAHMSVGHRAKQFAPFAALKGYEEAIQEKEILYVPYEELSDDQKSRLDMKLRLLAYKDRITATYFLGKHSPADGIGQYHTITGTIEYIDTQERRLRIDDTEIDFEMLTDLQGDCFCQLEMEA